ncbi:MAG: hypothetical protein SGI92_18880 [Bryobacteraceae bacterium]|nr:hypothetical protein [Bryobacteraceae bacterium]
MNRRSLIFLPLFLAACSKSGKSLEDLLPHELGGWKRGDVTTPAEVPAAAEALGAVGSAGALYLGEGRVRVRVLEMKAETVAFELMQRWRPQTDGLGTYKGRHFFIAQGEAGSTPETVMQLLGLLQKAAAV